MNIYGIIAIFCAPILGVEILTKKEKLNWKELVLVYLRYLFLINLVTSIVVYVLKGHNEFIFTVSFFIKYGVMNITFSAFIALFEIALKKNIKVDLNEKKSNN